MRAPISSRRMAVGLAVLAGAALWQAWGATAAPMPALDRRQLMRLLGAVPDGPPPLAAEQIEKVDLGDVVREKVTYAVEAGERVPAFLFRPKTGGAPLPAVRTKTLLIEVPRRTRSVACAHAPRIAN